MQRVGIDLDGVLANYNEAAYAELSKLTNTTPNIEWNTQPTMWHWPEHYFDPLVVKEFRNGVQEGIGGWRFWGSFGVYPEARAFINRMKVGVIAGDVEPWFITTRPKGVRRTTQEWLKARFHIETPNLILTHEKGAAAKCLELDIMVDDKPENLIDVLAARGTKCRCYLLTRPWNKSFTHSYITRVDSLEQVTLDAQAISNSREETPAVSGEDSQAEAPSVHFFTGARCVAKLSSECSNEGRDSGFGTVHSSFETNRCNS